MKKNTKFDNLGGSKKYLEWLDFNKKYNQPEKSFNLHNDYKYELLIAEFDGEIYNYGFIIKLEYPLYISFGQTHDSNNGEFRSFFMSLVEFQNYYDSMMDSFHNIEKIIELMINNNLLKLVSLDLTTLNKSITFLNIMALILMINLNVKNIIHNKKEHNINQKFIKLIQFIYEYDTSIITINPIFIKDHLCSKVIPIKDIEDIKCNEFIEIDINKKITKKSFMFAKFIDWTYIKPLTEIFFNNIELKKKLNNKVDITSFIQDTEHKGIKVNNIVESYVGILFISEYVGIPLYDIQTLDSFTEVHIFELMYGLFLLHSNNVIHGNICLSNLTIKEKDFKKDFKQSDVNVFILSEYGEIDTYVCNNNLLQCYIIDFSNAIVNSSYFDDMGDSLLYCQKQYTRVSDILESYGISEKIINIDEIFHILCFIDYIQLSDCLLKLFKGTSLEIMLYNIYNTSLKILKLFLNNIKKDLELIFFREIFNDYLFTNEDIDLNINLISIV